MKIAIPQWQGRVSPVFDASKRLLLIDIENGRQVCRVEVKMIHEDALSRAKYMALLGVDILICGVISLGLANAIAASGIKMFPCTCGSVDRVLKAYIDNQLSNARFLVPGCDKLRGLL
ncbi:MAG: NifB/NifX family molybdenum-iron cluster-binding protein [Desulfobacterales bacterium]|nr:NifB/NifX family molybdenum-iron cluster-binding protein [Desulfobacterales bacterium]